MPTTGRDLPKIYIPSRSKHVLERAQAFFAREQIQRRRQSLVDSETGARQMVDALVDSGLSRTQIARGAGVDLSQFCGWMAGSRGLGEQQLERVYRWARRHLRGAFRAG